MVLANLAMALGHAFSLSKGPGYGKKKPSSSLWSSKIAPSSQHCLEPDWVSRDGL